VEITFWQYSKAGGPGTVLTLVFGILVAGVNGVGFRVTLVGR
jgi:hypothetical protein